MRDVRAIVTERGTGCDGRCWRQAGSHPPDETFTAYGEVVWSWRRDPGATLAASVPLTTGARKAASPGRARRKPLRPLRGESRDVSAVPVKPVCFLSLVPAHGAAGAVGARLSLRPLQRRGTTNFANSGENLLRERKGMSLTTATP